MVSENKVSLNKRQIEFIVKMMEIRDPMEAVKAFAKIMMDESVSPSKMSEYVDKIIERMKVK